MPIPRSEFLATAQERGFIHQCTDQEGLDTRLSRPPLAAYVGYDCTADSLHVGSLVSIMLLRLFQNCGHKPIVLLGGGTSRIGDPSGKDKSRRLLSASEIARNKAGLSRIFDKFIAFDDSPSGAVMADNADWLDELLYIPLLREVGRHFSIGRMLSQESVRLRLEREEPLTFLEFNYMILQAYDFRELSRRYGCELQFGGSDQWGNIVAGIELARKSGGKTLYGLTTPLLTTASGAKMGKTAEGAVWLNSERLSPYRYWQFWRNTEDADVGRFLRLFTELPMAEILRLEGLEGQEKNEAKKILATEATALCHGREAALKAAQSARAVFEEEGKGDALPQIGLARESLAQGVAAFEIFVRAGLASSNAEARRLIRGGGARVNDRLLAGETETLSLADLDGEGRIKLSAGKKRHALVRAV